MNSCLLSDLELENKSETVVREEVTENEVKPHNKTATITGLGEVPTDEYQDQEEKVILVDNQGVGKTKVSSPLVESQTTQCSSSVSSPQCTDTDVMFDTDSTSKTNEGLKRYVPMYVHSLGIIIHS